MQSAKTTIAPGHPRKRGGGLHPPYACPQIEQALLHSRRFTYRKKHGSDYSNMTGIIGKTTNRKLLGVLPIDRIRVNLRYLSCPFQHFIHGCFFRPVQPGRALDNGSFDYLWVGGSKKNGPPDHSVASIQSISSAD